MLELKTRLLPGTRSVLNKLYHRRKVAAVFDRSSNATAFNSQNYFENIVSPIRIWKTQDNTMCRPVTPAKQSCEAATCLRVGVCFFAFFCFSLLQTWKTSASNKHYPESTCYQTISCFTCYVCLQRLSRFVDHMEDRTHSFHTCNTKYVLEYKGHELSGKFQIWIHEALTQSVN